MMLQRFKVGGRVHTVNDFVVTADLRGQLDRHVSPGWYAVVFFSDGRGIARGATADTPTPAPYILNWMMKVAEALNRQAHHGGHWVAAAEAEERAAQEQHEAPIGNAAEPQGDAAASKTPADDEGLPDSTPGAVPYARFSQVNQKLNQAAAELEFMRGKVEAMEALAKGGSAPANQPAPTGQQQTAPAAASPDPIKAHRDAIKAEAQRYDAGEITLTEYEAFRMEREDQIQAIHLQRVTEQAARQVAQPSMADEAMLAAHAKALDSQYPYLQVMSQDQLLRLRDMAIMEANQNGRPFGNSANDTRLLRERVAQLSVGFGPAWGLQIPQQTSANTQPSNRGATGQSTMSPAAQARVMKHGLAADMPPDTHNMGTAGNSETFSEQRIAAMTDEEILALPATVRQRFLTG